MRTRRQTKSGIYGVLENPAVRRVERGGAVYYAAADIVKVLTDTGHPDELWADLKQREPQLDGMVEPIELPLDEANSAIVDMVKLEGALRLIESIPSAKAERLKQWMARSVKARMDEAENPELAAVRMRKLYQAKGYSQRWIDKRLRGISARHELTSEWARRGASKSEEYRWLTNELMQQGFGMDVEAYRRFKELDRAGQNLRDHMSGLELVLTMLGEATAAALHRDRNSQSFEGLLADTRDAGQVVARTRQETQRHIAGTVVEAGQGAARRQRPVVSGPSRA